MDGMDGAGRLPRFEPSEAIIGITEPLGYFDPLGFSKQGDFEGFLGGDFGENGGNDLAFFFF